MNLERKKVLVVGFGITGEALCGFLLNQKAKVKVSEKKKPEEMAQKIHFWREQGLEIEAGGHNPRSFLESDLIIVSPGVPLLAELEAARVKGVKIISEIELAYSFLKGKIIGITGTNGKSTTATLTHKILKDAGFKSFLAGNIGNPLINFAEGSRERDIYVTEISSFQLQYIDKFRVSISIFLNISTDHLDWHSSFKDYYEAKKKLIIPQKKEAIAILNRDDPLVWSLKEESEAKVFGFSREKKVFPGCFLKAHQIILSNAHSEKLMSIHEIPLLGIHNQENVMAAALVGYIFEIPLSRIKKSIKSSRGLEHRLEKVLTLRGIDFYNDSKATNVDATLKSLQSFDQKIILILGGIDKGGDFSRLRSVIKEKVKKIILIGEAKEKIKSALNGTVEFYNSSSLNEAVNIGFTEAIAGEVVLLAPACTSFDMFRNFEERGKIFKREVFNLEKRIRKENH